MVPRPLLLVSLLALLPIVGCKSDTSSDHSTAAQIEVDAKDITGSISPYFFGQFIDHEHNTILGGLWAELLRDRKFEEGDADGDGVSNGWVPQERILDQYWQLSNGRGQNVRYFLDHTQYYGGGESQGIALHGPGSQKKSIYQIGLRLARGRRYHFYVYLMGKGSGAGFVELDSLGGTVYGHKDFGTVPAMWHKYEADFTATEDTDKARLSIGFSGAGTFWIDSASLMPADNLHGLRRDVVEAMRAIQIPLMRYPGGCFADYYHWENGIGDRDKRPDVFGDAWKEWDPNDFGTDEFMAMAEELQFAPQMTADYLSGRPEEAARWVQYLNAGPETAMGRLRTSNGHSEPYRVQFWAVGNEAPSLCSSQYTGGTKLNQYVSRYGDYKAAMQREDPSIHLMASSVGDLKWIHDLLNAMPVETLAISIYTGQYKDHSNDTRICDLTDYYRKVVAEPVEVDGKIEDNIRSIGNRFPAKSRFFAISEINSWWLSEEVDPDYRLANALYFAGVFNVLLRRADQILTAEASTTINVQGLIGVNPVAIKLTPPYFAYLLYANHIGNRVVKSIVHSPPVAFNANLPGLDSAATISSHGRTLYLAVINRDEVNTINATINFKNWQFTPGPNVQAFELNGINRDAANPYGSTANTHIQEKRLEADGTSLSYAFPPHSVTVLELGTSMK
jgi:alpha-L-arabinofuranosidase